MDDLTASGLIRDFLDRDKEIENLNNHELYHRRKRNIHKRTQLLKQYFEGYHNSHSKYYTFSNTDLFRYYNIDIQHGGQECAQEFLVEIMTKFSHNIIKNHFYIKEEIRTECIYPPEHDFTFENNLKESDKMSHISIENKDAPIIIISHEHINTKQSIQKYLTDSHIERVEDLNRCIGYPAQRTTSYTNFKDYLIISLKLEMYTVTRSHHNIQKIQKDLIKMTFDESIILYEEEYELCGIIIHIGENIQLGHYKSFLKRKNIWYCANDKSVIPITLTLNNAIKKLPDHETPYIYFYRKKNIDIPDNYKPLRNVPIGLQNNGNTCYLNSTMQQIFNNIHLYNSFETSDELEGDFFKRNSKEKSEIAPQNNETHNAFVAQVRHDAKQAEDSRLSGAGTSRIDVIESLMPTESKQEDDSIQTQHVLFDNMPTHLLNSHNNTNTADLYTTPPTPVSRVSTNPESILNPQSRLKLPIQTIPPIDPKSTQIPTMQTTPTTPTPAPAPAPVPKSTPAPVPKSTEPIPTPPTDSRRKQPSPRHGHGLPLDNINNNTLKSIDKETYRYLYYYLIDSEVPELNNEIKSLDKITNEIRNGSAVVHALSSDYDSFTRLKRYVEKLIEILYSQVANKNNKNGQTKISNILDHIFSDYLKLYQEGPDKYNAIPPDEDEGYVDDDTIHLLIKRGAIVRLLIESDLSDDHKIRLLAPLGPNHIKLLIDIDPNGELIHLLARKSDNTARLLVYHDPEPQIVRLLLPRSDSTIQMLLKYNASENLLNLLIPRSDNLVQLLLRENIDEDIIRLLVGFSDSIVQLLIKKNISENMIQLLVNFDENIIKLLIRRGDSKKTIELLLRLPNDIVKLLLQKNVDSKTIEILVPLINSSVLGHPLIQLLLQRHDVEIVRILLENNISVELAEYLKDLDPDAMRLLMYALNEGKITLEKLKLFANQKYNSTQIIGFFTEYTDGNITRNSIIRYASGIEFANNNTGNLPVFVGNNEEESKLSQTQLNNNNKLKIINDFFYENGASHEYIRHKEIFEDNIKLCNKMAEIISQVLNNKIPQTIYQKIIQNINVLHDLSQCTEKNINLIKALFMLKRNNVSNNNDKQKIQEFINDILENCNKNIDTHTGFNVRSNNNNNEESNSEFSDERNYNSEKFEIQGRQMTTLGGNAKFSISKLSTLLSDLNIDFDPNIINTIQYHTNVHLHTDQYILYMKNDLHYLFSKDHYLHIPIYTENDEITSRRYQLIRSRYLA